MLANKVILIMYDNPVINPTESKQARKFRKEITRMGFVSLQKSIYVKIIKTRLNLSIFADKLEQIAPENGDIKFLVVPLSVFKKLSNVRGKDFNMKLFSDDIITF